MCKICGLRVAPRGYQTCGMSECQEADVAQNHARNQRRGTKKWREAFKVAEEKIGVAIDAARRRAGLVGA